MAETASIPLRRRGLGWRLSALVGRTGDLFAAGERALAPILDLVIRVWLAQAFWLEGMYLALNFETAVDLSTHVYPVAWMGPVTAATLGIAIELAGSVLLVLGLATRFGALALLVLALINFAVYQQLAVTLFQAVLLGWYVCAGPGPMSLDRLLGRGIAATALPLTASVQALLRRMDRYGTPAYQLFLRLWIAGAFWMAGGPDLEPGQMIDLAQAVEWTCLGLLVVGLLTRIATLPLLAMMLSVQFATMQAGTPFYAGLILLLILFYGPGKWSLDRVIGAWLKQRYPRVADLSRAELSRLPHVVIVGAGFGGISTAKALARTRCRITLIDRRNYHLFQPLLYQVATASLSPADIAQPIRSLFRDQNNVRVMMGRVTDVDTEAKEVIVGDDRVPYEVLVLATGARHSYFGKDDWEPYAPGLKKIDDATDIRRRILLAFEQAETAEDPNEQAALLTFVVVGGGPTGVELAGAIAELAQNGMEKEFRTIDPASARVLLIQSAPRLLPPFPEALSAEAERSLTGLGVTVMTNSRVDDVDEAGVTIGGERIAARTVFWAAGVAASPAARWVQGEKNRSGQLKVGPDLSVPGRDGVFAIGDTALSEAWDGKPVPGLAPAAKQQGAYVARAIRRRLAGRKPPRPFRYKHMGSLATIGRKAAVCDFGRLRLTGAPAWWLWGAVHILFLVGARNRISVALEWFWAYLTFRRSIRLITGEGR